MKQVLPLLMAACIQADGQVSFLRQQQQGTRVVWDMPVSPTDSDPAPLTLKNGGTLIQLWSVDADTAEDHLLDQKLVGAYLPTATVKISTLDPYGKSSRTRVDQPFTVEIQVDRLLTGTEFPQSAASVLLERHLASYQDGRSAPDAAEAVSGIPDRRAFLNSNGKTVLRFEASSLGAADPTKASGEEHFVIHMLSDGSGAQTQIASAFVQVLPVASGAIRGISPGETLHSQIPQIELELSDLYPRSDTHLMLFEGSQINGAEGVILQSHPVDRETTISTVMRCSSLESRITRNGTYTLALVSDTVYGRELLCETVTFSVNRTLHADNRTDFPDP